MNTASLPVLNRFTKKGNAEIPIGFLALLFLRHFN